MHTKRHKIPSINTEFVCISASSVWNICFLKRLCYNQDVLDSFLILIHWGQAWGLNSSSSMILLHPTSQNLHDLERRGYLFLIGLQIAQMQIKSVTLGKSSKKRLRKYYPSNLEEVKWVKAQVWALVSPETCRDLINVLPGWMKEWVNIKSATTKNKVY